jgi:hypothetical protein
MLLSLSFKLSSDAQTAMRYAAMRAADAAADLKFVFDLDKVKGKTKAKQKGSGSYFLIWPEK